VIAIIDYDMGNVASVANMLKRIGVSQPVLTRDPEVLAAADKLILPGVGSFDLGMRNLRAFGLIEHLREAVIERGTPILGICLGMQLLTRSSEEGTTAGLGWIPGSARRFQATEGIKIPHMGWNETRGARSNVLLPAGMSSRFYFVHSYYVECDNPDHVLATTQYGREFASIVGQGKVLGVQFHPEKSHRYGMALLRNFADS
jgi:glutamine amidotransferase